MPPKDNKKIPNKSATSSGAGLNPTSTPTEKKKLDARIKTLIENCVKKRHRSFFVVVGNRAREQLVHLHYMLAKARVKTAPSILWCYKKELGFIA